uniref:TTF-type domain-containing protein n=1 Tax=Amphimedon queenslandica TaxID=400682 RepID=A0A1X7UTS8_AMPQE
MPPPSVLPSSYGHGCMRKFNVDWLRKYSWLPYSPSLNGVFCGPCSILLTESKRNGKGILVNTPFSNWVKISSTLRNHSQFSYHSKTIVAADALKTTTEIHPGELMFKQVQHYNVKLNGIEDIFFNKSYGQSNILANKAYHFVEPSKV